MKNLFQIILIILVILVTGCSPSPKSVKFLNSDLEKLYMLQITNYEKLVKDLESNAEYRKQLTDSIIRDQNNIISKYERLIKIYEEYERQDTTDWIHIKKNKK